MLLWQKARKDAQNLEETMPDLMSFPRDIDKIVERIGLEVTYAPLKGTTSGIILKRDKDSDPEIYIDSTEPRVRQRFTLAHELGHYYDRASAHDLEYSFQDKRSPSDYNLREFYADEFAGNLLMPAGEVERLRKRDYSIPGMAAYFGVSGSAMAMRLSRIAKAKKVDEASAS